MDHMIVKRKVVMNVLFFSTLSSEVDDDFKRWRNILSVYLSPFFLASNESMHAQSINRVAITLINTVGSRLPSFSLHFSSSIYRENDVSSTKDRLLNWLDRKISLYMVRCTQSKNVVKISFFRILYIIR